METIPYLGHSIRRWQIGDSTFLAWPEAGARLMRWQTTRPNGSTRDVLHWPELADLSTPVAKVRGGNPILFPFNARVFEGGEIHFWRDATGTRRAMPMHGFARQGTFQLTSIDETGFTARLAPTADDQACYPFDYTFTVTYRFEAERCVCTLTLQNHGEVAIPWSAGHHFYFAAPWTADQTRDDYVIQLPRAASAKQTATGDIVPGPHLPRRCPLSHPDLVDTIHVGMAENHLRFGPADGSEFVALTNGSSTVPHPEACFVTWTADPDAPYYCVEPWMGPPNAPGHGRGLHHVTPGQTENFTVTVAIG
ncbi:aldose epimerase [Synoicihabitans lomoniglobus]|uniref:Aldose epimerase n=1 Tax=Synoicihabitans lomoniglobus TaxID=2909285 RepID=A0AAF0CH84_9BACT|nr:aldose epimerase [Opitutaceae bacterium LMO-M01]WED63992.1 aldose epimerase [Opitutaceae bacterium LMO-M01]